MHLKCKSVCKLKKLVGTRKILKIKKKQPTQLLLVASITK